MNLHTTEENMSSFELASQAASSAWLCNTTLVNTGWSLRQLHGLVNLMMHVRDELVAILAKGIYTQKNLETVTSS